MSIFITWHSLVIIKSDSPAAQHPKTNKQKGTATVVVPQPFTSDVLMCFLTLGFSSTAVKWKCSAANQGGAKPRQSPDKAAWRHSHLSLCQSYGQGHAAQVTHGSFLGACGMGCVPAMCCL